MRRVSVQIWCWPWDLIFFKAGSTMNTKVNNKYQHRCQAGMELKPAALSSRGDQLANIGHRLVHFTIYQTGKRWHTVRNWSGNCACEAKPEVREVLGMAVAVRLATADISDLKGSHPQAQRSFCSEIFQHSWKFEQNSAPATHLEGLKGLHYSWPRVYAIDPDTDLCEIWFYMITNEPSAEIMSL